MEQTRDVIVEVNGGTVVAVYSDIPGVNIILVDWDNIEAGDPPVSYPFSSMADMTEDTRSRYEQASALSTSDSSGDEKRD